MNNKYLVGLLVGLLVLSGSSILAQDFRKLDKSPLDIAYYPQRAAFRAFEKDDKKREQAEPVMRLIYSRPNMNGRTIFADGGGLIPYGKIWRLGANENAELTVMKSVNIGGTTVDPGRYGLHVIPNKDHWTIILNSEVDTWGSYFHDEAKDVARIKAAVFPLETAVEALTVVFRDHSMDIAWENTLVSVPVNADKGMPQVDKSPLDMSYYPNGAAHRGFEKNEAKRNKMAPVARIMYSRTMKKGRPLYGSSDDNLVKYGEVWRLGANENAELQVVKTINIGGEPISPGRYGVYVIPNADSWTLIINKDLDGWGAYAYDESQDVARVTGSVSSLDESVEALSVVFNEDSLLIAWGKTLVTIPVKG